MKHPRRISALTVSILICVLSSTVHSGNLLMMIAPLLGKHSSSTEPLAHQAVMVGPLSGTSIKAFKIEDLMTPTEGPKQAVQSNSSLLAAGTFDLALAGLADNEWIVAEASGGADIDADSNGVADASPTQNLGTLHALARASDWRSKHLRITPLTEIGWRYVENLISAVSAEELEIRLADLARYLIKSDINGNGTIDWDDILAFDPAKAADKAKLAFDYGWLSTANDAGQTILASLRAGETDAMLAQLDETFSWLMTRFPVPDSRYHTVQVTLAVFGPGKATSGAPHNLAVDSTLSEPVYEDHIFLSEDDSGMITFTATAGDDAHILSWSGCENVSADLTQCTVALNNSQSVVANFGRTETILNGVVHDLSPASNTLGTNAVSVLLSDDMNDLIDELAAAKVGDFIVGDDGDGFLRKITGIKKISSTSYQFDTADAALDEVIAQGTGHLFKQMTNGDLEGYTAPAAAGQPATVSPTAFSGLEGTSLKVSERPDDTRFVITLGEEPASSASADGRAMTQSLSTEVVFDDGKGGKISAKGEISLDISIDTGFDYKLFDGLQGFKFIVKADAKQKVEFTASATLAKFDLKKIKIGTIPFGSIKFMIGFVPVWVTPTVDIYLFLDGSIELQSTFGLSLEEKMQGGVLYNKNTGFSGYKSFSKSLSPIFPTAKINASIRGELLTSPAIKIYSATGPAIPLKAYMKIERSDSFSADGCIEKIVQILAGIEAEFKWDMSTNTKIGKLFHLDKLEKLSTITAYKAEWPLKKWTIESSCPDQAEGPFLEVAGDGIFSTIDVGDASGLATVLTVSNSGDEDLHWKSKSGAAAISITPSSGVLAPGEEELVQMSVATAYLPVGRYLRKPFFYNEASVGQKLPDEEFGNTYKTVDIDVNDLEPTDTPMLDAVDGSVAGQASLDWTFTPETSEPWIGFQIFAVETSAEDLSDQLLQTSSIYDRHAVISGLTPGADYSFKMQAYSNNNSRLGPYSNVVSAHIAGTPPSSINTVTSATGRIWMDRNLGASRTATSMTDTEAYGDLYQWGRRTDGHEKRDSGTTSTLSSTDVPGHDKFILSPDDPNNWRNPPNDNLWQGVDGINNPCPTGFRVPTADEWQEEIDSWSSQDDDGAYGSPLKLVIAGGRSFADGSILNTYGLYWTTMSDGTRSVVGTSFAQLDKYPNSSTHAFGYSVRCILNEEPLQCGGPQKEAGEDTPEIYSYNMGKNSGSFQFDYESYSIKDRIIIKHENLQIFDTGCVGESRTVTINFSGSSPVISVEVIPNCDGSSGTSWNYTVHCPN